MDEQTSLNSASDEVFDGGLNFNEADFEGDDADDDAEEGKEQEQRAEEPKEAAPEAADFLTIRYNKADKTLTRAEAVELAQKGMNYDKVLAELDGWRSGPLGKALKSFADQAGMTMEEYADMMAKQADAAAEKKAMDELREKWPDAPDDLLKEHVRLQRSENQAKAASAEEIKRQKEWDDALAEYPDIKPETVPQEVLDAMAEGAAPLEALRKHEVAELRKKLAELTSAAEVRKKQDDNRARSAGSLRSNAKGQEDDFLAEFA